MNPRKSKPKITMSPAELERYRLYQKHWRYGMAIPALAQHEGCTNKEMHSRIAFACGVSRFGPEMKAWKRDCNRVRRARGELPDEHATRLRPAGLGIETLLVAEDLPAGR